MIPMIVLSCIVGPCIKGLDECRSRTFIGRWGRCFYVLLYILLRKKHTILSVSLLSSQKMARD